MSVMSGNREIEINENLSSRGGADTDDTGGIVEATNGYEFKKNENLRIYKNVVILGFAFMIHFTAFHGTSNLQSSVNSDASLGAFTLASIYGSLIISNIFLPVIVIRWLGCKWTIALSFIAYMPFIIAQFFPRFYTLIPAGLFVGFGGGPLWCAKCTYLTVAAEAYCKIKKDKIKSDIVVVRFFSLFFMFYQMAQVWGNLISSTVLTNLPGVSETMMSMNVSSAVAVRDVGEICGANFCPGIDAAVNPNLQRPDQNKIQILSGIFLGCMIIACLAVVFGVDSLKRYDMGRKGSGYGLSGFELIAVTVKQLTQKYQLLLLPITMFIGAEQAFIAVDFTASFVACGWGISKIGYVMICFGIANAIAAALAGPLNKIIGRKFVMLSVYVLHICIIIWMIFWRAVEKDYLTYCTIAALWGLADGIWLVEVNALSGILFPDKEEAAFSNFRLWEATGSVITYALSPSLCTSTKLYTLLCLMTVGIICFGTIEISERKHLEALEKVNFELVDEKESIATHNEEI